VLFLVLDRGEEIADFNAFENCVELRRWDFGESLLVTFIINLSAKVSI
jgi:hypothetical protein